MAIIDGIDTGKKYTKPRNEKSNSPMRSSLSSDLEEYWWLTQVPELEGFLDTWLDTTEEVNVGDFLQALALEPWWKDSTAEWRASEEQRLTDFTTWEEGRLVKRDDLERFAGQLGYTLFEGELDHLSELWTQKNWTAAEAEREILNLVYHNVDEFKEIDGFQIGGRRKVGVGSIQSMKDNLSAFANSWMATIDPSNINEWAHQIKSEDITLEQAQQYVVDSAGLEYDFVDPDLMDRIYQKGMTLSDHLYPVQAAMANVWELNPQELDLTSPEMKDLLTITDDNNKTRFLNSREAKNLAYKDPRYRETTNYKGKMNNFGSAMAQFFGVRS